MIGAFAEIIREMERMEEKAKGNLRTAEELGLIAGDMVIWKDGDVDYIEDLKDELRYKNIAEVKRPVEWEEIKVKTPRKRRSKKEDK